MEGEEWARYGTAIYDERCWTPRPPSYSSSSPRKLHIRALLLQHFAMTEWCRGRKVWEKALAGPIIDTPSGGVSKEGGGGAASVGRSRSVLGEATREGSLEGR